MSDRSFHPLDYVSLVKRRAWWAIVPLVACLVAGVVLTRVLPRVYRSSATIGVSAPRVSADLVGQGAPMGKDERVRAVSQQLLSRPVLERVVREEGLARGGRTVDDVVDEMLSPDRVRVEPMQLWKQVASDRAPLDAFVLSYAGPTPQQAQRVTNRLAQVFVETTSRSREARAEDTSAFIGTQLEASKARLDTLEAQLRKAKEAYMGRLPEQTSANLSMVSGLRQQLESTAIGLRGEQDRLSMIDRQVDAMKQGAAGDEVLPGGIRLPPAQARAVALQQQLADARTRYTEKHPEVQRLHAELEDAKKAEAAERAQPQSDRLARLQLDPQYRQLAADRETARLRVADLQRAEQQLRAQVSMYQSRVESAPMVEQQFVSLQRDYDLEKQQYTALSERRRAAELAESLERGQAGEQFKVLYAAFLPRDPESPNAVRLLLLSLVLGIGAGGAAALAREYFDRSVHDLRALQAEFDVPVLAEISRIPPYHARSAR
jgi:polysaccharide chain length determinant protein (PEP-CTERM system associated)